MAAKITFDECWAIYKDAHKTSLCRWIHFGGTCLAVIVAYKLVVTGWWYLVPLSPIVVYVVAWPAHRFIEHNNPTSWTSWRHLYLSIFCDLKMCGEMLRGRMW
jgi:hypothetical protein